MIQMLLYYCSTREPNIAQHLHQHLECVEQLYQYTNGFHVCGFKKLSGCIFFFFNIRLRKNVVEKKPLMFVRVGILNAAPLLPHHPARTLRLTLAYYMFISF